MLNNLWFSFIHKHFLVYNCSWEDPAIDRQLLQLNNVSEVLMITGAGDNALDYLLDQPAYIHAVDLNYRQNALLNFKRRLFHFEEADLLQHFFLDGDVSKASDYLQHTADHFLSGAERDFLNTFFSRRQKIGFYRRGSTGLFSRLLSAYIRQQTLDELIQPLFEFRDLKQQQAYYHQIEEVLWQGRSLKLMDHPLSSSLLGVPGIQLSESKNRSSLLEYLKTCLRNVFTYTLGMHNYFWKMYFYGAYDESCAPNYLKKEHFDAIRKMIERIQTHTGSLIDHLRSTNRKYTHFVLLDHMDWYHEDSPALEELWNLIQRTAQPGARVLFRTVRENRNFLPDAASAFSFQDELTKQMHRYDRVGTYRGTHLGILNH